MTEINKDVQIIEFENKTIYLVGTAHVSQNSIDIVRTTIQTIKPDTICVELDHKRLEALQDSNRWEKLNLREIIKKGQMTTLIANLALSSYQKRMGNSLGVKPGSELLAAVEEGNAINAHIDLSDRDIQITLKRAWRKTGFFKRLMLGSGLIGSLFETEELSEDKLDELKDKDTLSAMMDEMGEQLPTVKQVLIDERDEYLAEKIRQAPGNLIVAVVGAGHCPGITKILNENTPVDLAEIEIIPSSLGMGKIIIWTIPLIIIASFIGLAMKDTQLASESGLVWVLANGIPAAIGAMIALAHPLVIIVAFLAAPITSLVPTIGAGVVTALLQVYLKPPRVYELEKVSEEISQPKLWWKNRVLKVFLAFLLPSLGSAIGSIIGAVDLFQAISGQ
tara:strand:- start:114 stop:1289 length:1176 start_codon:yes stop_codon:yes gene_type:complete